MSSVTQLVFMSQFGPWHVDPVPALTVLSTLQTAEWLYIIIVVQVICSRVYLILRFASANRGLLQVYFVCIRDSDATL